MVSSSKDSRKRSWVLLAYRLPREPSSPRIALWRKLKRLGVAQILDGLVALPLSNNTREQLEWLADEVLEAGGEATIWLADLASSGQHKALAAAMTAQISADYRAVAAEAERSVVKETAGQQKRTLARLRRRLRGIHARDYFPPPERERAHQAIEGLATQIGEPVT